LLFLKIDIGHYNSVHAESLLS